MMKRLRELFDRRPKVEVGYYGEEKRIGRLMGFVRTEFQDGNAYPAKVMFPATAAIVDLDGELKEFRLSGVRVL